MKKILTPIARSLRKELTYAEKLLWQVLRFKSLGVKFRKQSIIGQYIVDFACYEKKLVIEIDGGQHCENNNDVIRDHWLKSLGFTVLRFWNDEVIQNIEGVYTIIEKHVNPRPALPTEGEGEL